MADIEHEDTYQIKDPTATIGVRVRTTGGHSAVWVVRMRDKPIPPQPDGFVSLGVGSALKDKVAVVKVNLAKIARGRKFAVELEMREISAIGGATTPIEVKGDFGTENTIDVTESITFA